MFLLSLKNLRNRSLFKLLRKLRLLFTSPSSDLVSQEKFKAIERSIGVKIRNKNLISRALTHRSFVTFAKQRYGVEIESNERLEFLGDVVLNLIASEMLYKAYPFASEGELTRLRSKIVCEGTLIKCAYLLNLDEHMLLSNSARKALRRGHNSMLADAFEAVVGAVYLDSGFEAAKKFLSRVFKEIIGEFDKKFYESIGEQYKSILIEYSHKTNQKVHYKVANVEGPEHEKVFTVEVFLGNKVLGVGQGKSKKEAEKIASYNALINLGLLSESQQ